MGITGSDGAGIAWALQAAVGLASLWRCSDDAGITDTAAVRPTPAVPSLSQIRNFPGAGPEPAPRQCQGSGGGRWHPGRAGTSAPRSPVPAAPAPRSDTAPRHLAACVARPPPVGMQGLPGGCPPSPPLPPL